MYKTALLVLSFLVKWVNTCKDLQRETQSKLSVNDACNYAMTPQDRPGWKCRSYQKAYFHSLRTSNNQNCCLHWMWGLWGEELLVIRPSNRLDSVDRTSGPAKSLHTISFKVPFNSKILGVYRKSLSLPFLLELIIFFPLYKQCKKWNTKGVPYSAERGFKPSLAHCRAFEPHSYPTGTDKQCLTHQSMVGRPVELWVLSKEGGSDFLVRT